MYAPTDVPRYGSVCACVFSSIGGCICREIARPERYLRSAPRYILAPLCLTDGPPLKASVPGAEGWPDV